MKMKSAFEQLVIDKLYYDLRKFSQCYFGIDVKEKFDDTYHGIYIIIDAFDRYEHFKWSMKVMVKDFSWTKDSGGPALKYDNIAVDKSISYHEDEISTIYRSMINYLQGYDFKYLLGHIYHVNYSYLEDIPSYENKLKMFQLKPYVGTYTLFRSDDRNTEHVGIPTYYYYYIKKETPKTYVVVEYNYNDPPRTYKIAKNKFLPALHYPFISVDSISKI